MVHLNNNSLVTLLGKSNGEGELIELAMVELDKVWKHTGKPLFLQIKPKVKGTVSQEHWEFLQEHGLTKVTAIEVFEKWYYQLNLKDNKRIIPLTYNWNEQYLWIKELLIDMDDFFAPQYLDILQMAFALNCVADISNYGFPYPKLELAPLITRLGLDYKSQRHNCMVGAVKIAEGMKTMLTSIAYGGIFDNR